MWEVRRLRIVSKEGEEVSELLSYQYQGEIEAFSAENRNAEELNRILRSRSRSVG